MTFSNTCSPSRDTVYGYSDLNNPFSLLTWNKNVMNIPDIKAHEICLFLSWCHLNHLPGHCETQFNIQDCCLSIWKGGVRRKRSHDGFITKMKAVACHADKVKGEVPNRKGMVERHVRNGIWNEGRMANCANDRLARVASGYRSLGLRNNINIHHLTVAVGHWIELWWD